MTKLKKRDLKASILCQEQSSNTIRISSISLKDGVQMQQQNLLMPRSNLSEVYLEVLEISLSFCTDYQKYMPKNISSPKIPIDPFSLV